MTLSCRIYTFKSLMYSNIWANLREPHLLKPGATNSGFQKSLNYHYKEMINNFPNLKSVFQEPPILSYRRNQNLCNLLVRSSFNRPPPCHTASNSFPCQNSRRKLCLSMSNSNLRRLRSDLLNPKFGSQKSALL